MQTSMDFNERDRKKSGAYLLCKVLLEKHPEFRGDDLHALPIHVIMEEFGVRVTSDMVRRWSTLDRTKRAVQKI